ncbi:MAG: TlpA family protein disulfide reductase [Oligoflexales bacterium]
MAYLNILSLCLFLGSCAQFYTTKTTSDNSQATVVIQSVEDNLEGSFINENGDEVFLADLQDKPIVLMFSAVTCSTCITEAKEIINSFKKGAAKSDVVNFVTVLVDNKRIDRWKRAFKEKKPEWLHGYELSGELYFKYFPRQADDPEFPLTPAMVLYHPFKNDLFLNKGLESLGDVSLVDYIRSHVGLWES